MKKLLVRSISGAIYVIIIVGFVIGGRILTWELAAVLAILGLTEFKKICSKGRKIHPSALMLDCAGVLTLVSSSFFPHAFYVWVGIYLLRCIEELYMKEENSLVNLSESLFGQIYLGIPLSFMPIVAATNNCDISGIGNPLLAVFIFIWLSDTGAFVFGSLFGKRPLFKRISPNKSWEGFFGGLITCVVTSLIFSHYCASFFNLPDNYCLWSLFALTVVIFSTWGDLLESLIKRTLGIKDSGNMIPGHGGILDRIDSLLLALPAAAIYLYFMI